MGVIGQVVDIILVRHPLHPLSVNFPIALSFVGVVLVMLAYLRKDHSLEAAAYYDLVFLALSIPVTAALGIYDNITRYQGTAPYASVKIALALGFFLVTLALVFWRCRRPMVLWSGWGLLYITGFALCALLAFVLGFLGGIIVFGT